MDAAFFRRCLLALLACAALAPAGAQTPAQTPISTAVPSDASRQRQLQHAQLQSERDAVQARLLAQEADCYQRVAVTDCLHQARSAARAQDTALLHQQHQIDEAERRDKAAQRLRTIEDKERAHAERGTAPPAAQGTVRGEPPRRVQRVPQGQPGPADSEVTAPQERATAQQAQAEHSAQARERYEAKQEKARLRREAQEQRRAEDAAAGRVPAPPLPEPPAAPAPMPGSQP